MKKVLDQASLHRALVRLAHEIIERNKGIDQVVLVGIKTRGIPLAHRLQHLLHQFEGQTCPLLELDPTFFRDDYIPTKDKPDQPFPLSIDKKDCILVDDVIQSGRTIRASMDALIRQGRPKTIQVAVMVDRGHRELPIKADYVGKNLPTSHQERVNVLLTESDGQDAVIIE